MSNKDLSSEQRKVMRIKDREKIRRKRQDPVYKRKRQLKEYLGKGLKNGFTATSKLGKVVGCDSEALKEHLISTAIKNYGYYSDTEEYECDHVIPTHSGKTVEEVENLYHKDNTQLLYPRHNRVKGDKHDFDLQVYIEMEKEGKV